jgi:hypothetical protein
MASLSTLISKATSAAKKAGVSNKTINAVKNSVAGKIATATASAIDKANSSKKSSSGAVASGVAGAVSAAKNSGSTSRSVADAVASGDFDTPFNGNSRSSKGSNYSATQEMYGKSNNYGYGTYKEDLDRLTKAQRQAQIDELKAARTQALASLDAQEQAIKPTYENARNLTSASSQQGARNFSEYLANRGLTNSGASAQGEINRQSALINNLGNINTAEANAYRDIANQRTAVENNYVSGLANANNALTSNYYNNLLNYNEQQRQLIQNLQQQALGQYANNYQAYMNTLDPNSMEYLYASAARGNKVANQYNSAQNNALASIQAGNINYNNAAALGWTIPQAQAYYDNLQAQAQATALAEQEALNRQVAQQNWENAYKENQLQWNQNMDYNNYLLNQQKVANDTRQTNASINNINSQIAKRNQAGKENEETPAQLSWNQVQNLIANMSSSQAKAKIDSLYNAGLISDLIFDAYQ